MNVAAAAACPSHQLRYCYWCLAEEVEEAEKGQVVEVVDQLGDVRLPALMAEMR